MDTSYLTSQVATIIAQLHGLFDEIGVPNHERESREAELFSALSETLHNHVKIVTTEKSEMVEEAQKIITTIKQMEQSLDDTKSRHEYEAEHSGLKVTYPLSRCLQALKEKHIQISKIHRERFEQVKKLVQALESYSSHLESSFVKIALPPTAANATLPPTFDLSPSYVEALDNEFTRVYEEYTRRIATVKALSENIIQLWAELGTPQAQTDASIVKHHRDSPEQLGLHEEDVARLRSRRDRLVDEKKSRERRLKELKSTVESLWERLGIEEHERKQFLNSNRGCGIRQINEFEDELARLNELKHQNLHLFVEEARYKLQELWDALYFSEEEMLDFTPAFSDVYSDALLSAHEQEINRLEVLKEQRAPTLALVERHRTLIKERNELAASSQDASRLMLRGQKGEKRDPTRLLREEKMRKRIAKELPKVAADLKKILEQWEDEYGRPFLVHGEPYIEELEASEAKAGGPRSRTPAAPPSAGKINPKSISKSNSVRGPPPSRSGAKTPTSTATGGGTLRRNPFANSVSSNAGGRTPSKIPARPPLSNLQHANNSPERRQDARLERASARPDTGTGTIRKMAPPARVPPPKMKDLFVPPQPPTPIERHHHTRSESILSVGSVRPVSPEDVYQDRRQYGQASRPQSYYDGHASVRLNESLLAKSAAYAPAPPPASRQASNTSTVTTTVSGSENWETYDDYSEPEEDASDAYYAKLRAARARAKRLTPEGGYESGYGTLKKSKGFPPNSYAGHVMVDAHGNRIVSGSEANWTDEDVF